MESGLPRSRPQRTNSMCYTHTENSNAYGQLWVIRRAIRRAIRTVFPILLGSGVSAFLALLGGGSGGVLPLLTGVAASGLLNPDRQQWFGST